MKKTLEQLIRDNYYGRSVPHRELLVRIRAIYTDCVAVTVETVGDADDKRTFVIEGNQLRHADHRDFPLRG